MPWSADQWREVIDRLAGLYRSDPEEAARQLRQHRHFFLTYQTDVPLVSVHRVISGLKGKDMLAASRSGQNLGLLRPNLASCGFSEVSEGTSAFEPLFKLYADTCADLGTSPSSGKLKPARDRTFFLPPLPRDDTPLSPEDLARSTDTYEEGATRQVTRNLHERDRAARDCCIAHYRAQNGGRIACLVCGMDFGSVYGALGEGFIHVHHLDPLAEAEGPRKVLPDIDLVPLCPNCHAMVHQRQPPLRVTDLVALLKRQALRGSLLPPA